jgi:hypothetical protein
MVGVDRNTKQGICKVYIYETNQNTGKEYRKFFRWRKMRIRYFLCSYPPESVIGEYKNLRKVKTDQFLDSVTEYRENKKDKAENKNKRERTREEVLKRASEVYTLLDQELSYAKIRAKTGLTDYWIDQIRSRRAGENNG